MNEELFRKKSLDKVKSPESLDDYIRVSNPGVWLLLISVIVLLAGACVWGIFGRIDSTVPAAVHAEGGTVVCRVLGQDAASVKPGMRITFSGIEAEIGEIGQPDSDGCVCSVVVGQTVPDGVYDGKIVTETIRPLSFILN